MNPTAPTAAADGGLDLDPTGARARAATADAGAVAAAVVALTALAASSPAEPAQRPRLWNDPGLVLRQPFQPSPGSWVRHGRS